MEENHSIDVRYSASAHEDERVHKVGLGCASLKKNAALVIITPHSIQLHNTLQASDLPVDLNATLLSVYTEK